MDHEIVFRGGEPGPDGLTRYRPGDRVSGHLTLYPDRDTHARGVWLGVVCQIHGSGTAEQVVACEDLLSYDGDLHAGQPVTIGFDALLPKTAPLSYQGRRVKFDWQVRARVDIPIWRDPKLSFPFLVVPTRTLAEGYDFHAEPDEAGADT
jgi:hypothetical protein